MLCKTLWTLARWRNITVLYIEERRVALIGSCQWGSWRVALAQQGLASLLWFGAWRGTIQSHSLYPPFLPTACIVASSPLQWLGCAVQSISQSLGVGRRGLNGVASPPPCSSGGRGSARCLMATCPGLPRGSFHFTHNHCFLSW